MDLLSTVASRSVSHPSNSCIIIYRTHLQCTCHSTDRNNVLIPLSWCKTPLHSKQPPGGVVCVQEDIQVANISPRDVDPKVKVTAGRRVMQSGTGQATPPLGTYVGGQIDVIPCKKGDMSLYYTSTTHRKWTSVPNVKVTAGHRVAKCQSYQHPGLLELLSVGEPLTHTNNCWEFIGGLRYQEPPPSLPLCRKGCCLINNYMHRC